MPWAPHTRTSWARVGLVAALIPWVLAASSPSVLSMEDAVRLALDHASTYQQARLAERIAAESVVQARAALLPVVSIPTEIAWNSRGPLANEPALLGADAVMIYRAGVAATGDFDLAGARIGALKRDALLLAAAREGTEAARRALVEATREAHLRLSFVVARRQVAEESLRAAVDFEDVIQLLQEGGEVPRVDLLRARVQTIARTDDAQQGRTAETLAADDLKVLIGYAVDRVVTVPDLRTATPRAQEIQRLAQRAPPTRPEVRQLELQREAAGQEARIARADLRPRVSWSLFGGVASDSLAHNALGDHTGVMASVSVAVPVFDWGMSSSRERQARLRSAAADSQRELVERTLAQQFRSLTSLGRSAVDRAANAELGVREAQKNLEATLGRYRGGEALVIEVIEAQNLVATEQLALNQAIFDFQQARVRLQQAVGE